MFDTLKHILQKHIDDECHKDDVEGSVYVGPSLVLFHLCIELFFASL